MKSTNPFRVLVFCGGVALTLAITALVLPENGLKLGFVKLKFLSGREIVQSKTIVKKDISKIVASVNTREVKEPKQITHTNSSKGQLGAPGVVNYEMNNTTGIYLEPKSSAALDLFFAKLKDLAQAKKKMHILHFGDSQIEGDRMTGFIRQRIQEKFGGYGPGLVPANNLYSTFAFRQNFSENFIRYTCFGGAKLSSKRYGVLNSAARFTAETIDSNATVQEAWIEVGPGGNLAHGRARSYNQVKIFYNSCTVPCGLKVYQGGSVIHEENLYTDGASHTVSLEFESNPGTLKFVFRSKKSPNIVGFSLEGDYGVQVDNIAMRGHSGTFFGAIDRSSFSQMMQDIHVDMVIMQFGGNSVPYLKDSADVRRNANYFVGQFQTLKRLKPDVAVLMIGPSDMSRFADGKYETYSLLPYWISQLKVACRKAGVGYWDLFEAMGGVNSMPAWVEKELGRSDHVHFSGKGSIIAAQLFYDAFVREYLKFEEK